MSRAIEDASTRHGAWPSRPFDISIVGTVGLPARYGGFETLAEQLVAGMAERYRMQVFCTSKRRTDRPPRHGGATLRFVGWDANGWQSIPYDIVSLWLATPRSRCVLVLGVSGCLALPVLRLLWPKTRFVTNIDGLEWKREKWGLIARLVLRMSESFAVRFSHAVIADNRGIADHVQQTYAAPSAVIPYGGDHAASDPARTANPDTSFADGSYALAICRIEPENHIGEILEAFASRPAWRLVVVGNWNASPYGRSLRERFAEQPNVELLDPIYAPARLFFLRRHARCYLHGHSAGGTNPSLVEAMSNDMAVLAFDVVYNRYTTEEMAYYWRTSDDLAALLARVDDAALQRCASAMKAIASREYTWKSVVARYESTLFPTGGPAP